MDLIRKADMIHAHAYHALISVGNKFLIAAGGCNLLAHSNCDLYEIGRDQWKALPPLNIVRRYHSGCVAGEKTVYLFGGWTNDNRDTNVIESLDFQGGDKWQVIHPENSFSPRIGSVVVEISSQEIMIFGGGDREKELLDAFVFNTLSKTIEKVSEDTGLAIKSLNDPVLYDSKTMRVFARNSHDKRLYKMQLDKFNRPTKWTSFNQ
jgi:hypothetical protein